MLKNQASEEADKMDQQIQRNVQKNILANRGLTRKRKKVDRNPRAKKRMQFERMEKKRKTAVKAYAGGQEKLYAGESTGIKMGLDRGIKM